MLKLSLNASTPLTDRSDKEIPNSFNLSVSCLTPSLPELITLNNLIPSRPNKFARAEFFSALEPNACMPSATSNRTSSVPLRLPC